MKRVRWNFVMLLAVGLLGLVGCSLRSTADEDYHPGVDSPKPASLSVSYSTQSSDLLSFGIVAVGSSKELLCTITNNGEKEATHLGVSGVNGPFSFTGGSYPGIGGDCGDTLAPNASCRMACGKRIQQAFKRGKGI